MSESDRQARILLEFGARPGLRLFRNTVGEGWQGKKIAQTDDTVTLLRPRYVTFGLCPGSADLIGWYNGRFLAAEIKDARKGARANQSNFLNAVLTAGGIAGVVRDPDDMTLLLL